MMKKINKSILLFVLIFALVNASTIQAANKNVVKEQTYQTEDSTKTAEFEDVITENGKKYKLKDVTYEVVKSEPIKQLKTVELVQKRTPKKTEEYIPQETIIQNDIEYKLDSVKKDKKVVHNAWNQKVSAFSVYDSSEKAREASDIKVVKVEDEETGDLVDVDCQKTTVERLEDKWVETHIDILFTGYDAETYVWNGVEIPKSQDTPLQQTYYPTLIKSVGGTPSNYKIDSLDWSGKSYIKDGVTYRNARANVSKKIAQYRVNYAGVIPHEAEEKTTYLCTYKGETEVETEKLMYTISAKALYEKSNNNVPILITVFLLLLLILVVGILFLVARKKKNNKTI